MRRSLASLFVCSVVSACGGGTPATGVINPPGPPPPGANLALRFFGTNSGDIDRVKIPLLAAGASLPVNGLGTQSFTLEFWIKGTKADNPTPSCTAGTLGNGAWMSGAVVIDRDVLGDGDFGEYGVSLFGGQVAFGVSRNGGGQTICGARDVLDSAWHHVAVTRQLATGELRIFVDGALDATVASSGGNFDVSYNPLHATPAPGDPVLVLGAQKSDRTGLVAGAASFNGLIDELRLSSVLRYVSVFPRPTAAFVADGNTLALYHFDETSGTDILDASNGSASPGVLLPAASGAASHRSTDVPF